MTDTRKVRGFAFAFATVIFAAVLLFFLKPGQDVCLGVPVYDAERLAQYHIYEYEDLSGDLTFHGMPAAVDIETSTIYIPQQISDMTEYDDLEGQLLCSDYDYSLCFVRDERMEDLRSAVADGYSFRLMARKDTDRYMEYAVVFTTLPVLRLEGEFSHRREPDRWETHSQEVMAGELWLWTPMDPATGTYSVRDSHTLWHERGASTKYEPKRPWKLSLKNKKGQNRDLSFLGLGEDDDWILNPMVMDDTRLREMLFMDLWNEMVLTSDWNYKMSTAGYVEVVLNGRYDGVYLLQRRVDGKYLELGSGDALFKGKEAYPNSAWEAYDLIYAGIPEDQAYALMEPIRARDPSENLIDLRNAVDTNLFINCFAAADNIGVRNIFHLLEDTGGGLRHVFIPWDTDMSLGLYWNTEVGFDYGYDEMIHVRKVRQETKMLEEKYPEYSTMEASRWQELRTGVLREENVLETLSKHETLLNTSGAFARDMQRWGQRYGGADTVEQMKSFLHERLLWLDAYYAEALD